MHAHTRAGKVMAERQRVEAEKEQERLAVVAAKKKKTRSRLLKLGLFMQMTRNDWGLSPQLPLHATARHAKPAVDSQL